MALTQTLSTPLVAMTAALDVENLHKVYGKGQNATEALGGVTLRIEAGERFALLGPNGAGKTTLVSILATLLEPSSGTACILGKDVVREANAIRKMIGYVPQDIALYPMLSANENLRFFGVMQGLGGALLKERISEAFAISGLAEVAGKRVSTFSGGMKRRLNLAVGLLHRPRILLLDEPTVGVDPQSRNHILDSIKTLNEEQGITVLYTTHYMDEVESLCNRVAIIDHGEIIADDTVAALRGDSLGVAVAVKCDQPARLAHALHEIPGLTDILTSDDGRVSFTAETASDGLRALASVSVSGLQFADIDVSKPSLEQVFLRLTGRGLRD